MNCIIVDDEPLAREGLLMHLQSIPNITVSGSFNSAKKAFDFMQENRIDLVFLDIQMPGVNGLQFAATMPKESLLIFTTAYSQYALDSYEVDAIDYLVKPIAKERLEKAVNKAFTYRTLLSEHGTTESVENDFMLIKADRRYHKVLFKDILYIEGLKDYVVIYTEGNKITTAMNLKTIHSHLDSKIFARVSKSYLVNITHIDSFDNHTIYIRQFEIPIGDIFRKAFLEMYLGKDLSDKL
ncbi:LytTR family two component transcriptional regulator [Arcticibacter tournemirensis]|uniref:Response regulator transcription factor n=1 Tax=Arcticibacter tournemirensis TaxID=699437 RepID=A0A5M9HBM5_9SPHI|nr:LytTR family DNA-binding domain-containing protein [Arcticibacter tournemirensis]KAA8484100.1 response regulator transcription factor [Arcticibacter tournemirensis]TQM51837.1 LytTR family two component transcriptional regulator [Arcticibacter tournemirensis]